jgi:hypothetical protein
VKEEMEIFGHNISPNTYADAILPYSAKASSMAYWIQTFTFGMLIPVGVRASLKSA